MQKNIPDKYFYILIVILGLYFILRLIDQAKLMWIFPFDPTNDVSSFMALLYFLAKHGLHNIAPNWYGGISVLKFYSPGWFYFALPIYWITKNIQVAAYISMTLLFALAVIFVNILGKNMGLSKTKRIAFYLLFFANPLSIGNFIRLGALAALFAWVFFIAFFSLIMWYKTHEIDKRFYMLFIPLFSIMILSHPQETVLASTLLFSLILVKKERVNIIIATLISLAITSFWWYPFIRDLSLSAVDRYERAGEALWNFSGNTAFTSLALIIISFLVIAFFWIYWRANKKPTTDLLFFLPIGTLVVLLMTKIIIYIPFFNQVYTDTFMWLFILMILFYMFSMDFTKIPGYLCKSILIALIILPIVSIGISHYYTPYFAKNSPLSLDVLAMLEKVDGTYFILGIPSETAYSRAYYSYGAIYLNLTTASGWSTHEVSPERQKLFHKIEDTYNNYNNNNYCSELLTTFKEMKVTEIISYKEYCSNLQKCGMKTKDYKNDICLLTIY